MYLLHAILHFVTKHYDDLPDITVFVRDGDDGDDGDDSPPAVGDPIRADMVSKCFSSEVEDMCRGGPALVLSHNVVETHHFAKEENAGGDPVAEFIRKHSPVYTSFVKYTRGYEFAATRRALHVFPKRYYEHLMSLLARDGKKFEFVFERAIMTLFGQYIAKDLNRSTSPQQRAGQVLKAFDSCKTDTVFVLRTHVINENVKKMFGKMQHDLGPENVFMIFDETNGAVPEPFRSQYKVRAWDDAEGAAFGPCVVTIKESDCVNINSLHAEGNPDARGSMFRAEPHLCAIASFIRRSFDYMWLMEFDVYCHGDFRVCLEPTTDMHCDFLTTHYRDYSLDPTYPWWNDFYGHPSFAQVPLDKRRACFFPMNRFSRRLVEAVMQNLHVASGYCEVYFVTLAHMLGMTINEIPIECLGTFRYRPFVDVATFDNLPIDNKLYHPVKA